MDEVRYYDADIYGVVKYTAGCWYFFSPKHKDWVENNSRLCDIYVGELDAEQITEQQAMDAIQKIMNN